MKSPIFINGEKCVAWSYARHGLHDEYPADTQHPFDLSMYFAATKVFADPPGKVAPAFAGLTVNHEHAAKLHRAALTEGYAPGPPIAPKRDVMPAVIEWGIAILAALVITALIYAFWQLFANLGHFYAN